jgi:hypothetical protein
MSKRDEKIVLYTEEANKFNTSVDTDLLTKVVVGLGPSIYNADAEKVSCSDQSELDRLRDNFLKKKLGLTNSDDELGAAIKEVCEAMGSSNRNKYRAVFYYMLTVKFNKASIYA